MHAKLFLLTFLTTQAISSPLAHTGQADGIETRQKKARFEPKEIGDGADIITLEARQKKVHFEPKDYKRVGDGKLVEFLPKDYTRVGSSKADGVKEE